VFAKIREWADEVGVMHAVGDPSKQVLAKVLEDIEHLEEYVRAHLSPETGWLTPESVSGAEPPKPWRIDIEDGRPVLWTYLESWRKYLKHVLGELRQVSRRKETGEEVEWVDTSIKDLGPALSRTAFATLLRPYLSHAIRRDNRRRNLKVVFTSLEDIAKAREALRRALPESNFGECPPAPNAGETSRVQDAQTARAEFVQGSCTTCAQSCAGAMCSPGGGEESVKISESGESREEVQQDVAVSESSDASKETEEEKAREELERFIREVSADSQQEPAGAQQQQRGRVEKMTIDEILRMFEDIVKKYGEF